MLRHTIMLLIIAMTAACAEDEAPTKPTPDPFAGCSHDALASDEVFDPAQGPAVNAQGELIVPAGAVIATTYIALKPGDEALGALRPSLAPSSTTSWRAPACWPSAAPPRPRAAPPAPSPSGRARQR